MSLLDTFAIDVTTPATTFVYQVPGDRIVSVRTIIATAARDTGGAPDRAYLLTVATSTGPVAIVGAVDAGAEPGTCTITWANIPASSVASGADGVTVAPLVLPPLYPGYTITGDITSPAPADAWTNALVWYDYVLSSV